MARPYRAEFGPGVAWWPPNLGAMTQTTLGQYVLALGGFALLRRWYEQTPATRARYDDLLALAASATDDEMMQLQLNTQEFDLVEGYTRWADTYDGPNPLIETEEDVCNPMLARIAGESSGRRALDAGCGTGRKARTLVDLGYDVIGCDLTPAMLAHARTAVPEAEFREGVFEQLPVDDESVDLITSSLAVCHVEDPVPVFAEFARVLRPGGTVLVSDPHPTATLCGGQAFFRDELDLPFVRNQGRPIADYVGAALEAGLALDRLHEEPVTDAAIMSNPVYALYPELVRAAFDGMPWLLVVEASKSRD